MDYCVKSWINGQPPCISEADCVVSRPGWLLMTIPRHHASTDLEGRVNASNRGRGDDGLDDGAEGVGLRLDAGEDPALDGAAGGRRCLGQGGRVLADAETAGAGGGRRDVEIDDRGGEGRVDEAQDAWDLFPRWR